MAKLAEPNNVIDFNLHLKMNYYHSNLSKFMLLTNLRVLVAAFRYSSNSDSVCTGWLALKFLYLIFSYKLLGSVI